MRERPHLIVVGGFLAAGKTTLILAAGRMLANQGLRSAVILNDQGDSLVDTEFARSSGFDAGEVTGGCFCCRFSELVAIAEQLRAHSPDVIFAEPVGSCTDLSATILQPLQDAYGDRFQLAPLTVLVDPWRAQQLHDPDIAFLFQKQLEEADLVCFTKSDLYSDLPGLRCVDIRNIPVRQISASTGQGVAAWLDEVMSGELALSGTILDIDYERYAKAEAGLAWLNAELHIECDPALSPALLLGPLLDELDRALTKAKISIVHLKALDRTPTGLIKAALSSNGGEPLVEGALDASPDRSHDLLINLRASADPTPVREIVERALESLPGHKLDIRLNCFSPAAPKPERRKAKV
ncbi:MAG TPA: GTP-binding protein [Bryobacteraceae bacterium]|nr:GTP-binding protein [Bryobacteraceae bacterium]